jgi:hypothetical protein
MKPSGVRHIPGNRRIPPGRPARSLGTARGRLARHPLLILRSLATTIPVSGIVVAMCAAPHYTPLHLGLLYVPELAAAIITAIVFGVVFRTHLIHYYADRHGLENGRPVPGIT